MQLSERQRRMMRHAVGLDHAKKAYRNRYFCAADPDWEILVNAGLAKAQNTGAKPDVSRCYSLTKSGFEAVAEPGETHDGEIGI